MNVESLKSELQQVLDSDVVLRKEFNDLKRSLSDYRNQLIMRDEDCKRLQVTIDVLNTKLVVMERDNNNYKAELTSFKELRSTIKEQLQAKQDEIEARLAEIQGLKDDLNSIAAGYELKITETRELADAEIERVKADLNNQIEQLRENSGLRENNIRQEYEHKLAEVGGNWESREQTLVSNHQQELSGLISNHEQALAQVKAGYEAQLSKLSSGSQSEIDQLIAANQATITAMDVEFREKLDTLENTYKNEITNLRGALEEQRSTLTFNFNSQVEHLTNEYNAKELRLVEGYEKQIAELQARVNASSEELSAGFQQQINDLKSSHEVVLNETIFSHEARVTNLVNEYEEKLAYTLIHSNSQNSKLNEELSRAQFNNERSLESIKELGTSLESKNAEIIALTGQISNLEQQLRAETEKYLTLTTEFEGFKQSASLSVSEQVNELNQQIVNLNLAHSEVVNELNGQIAHLNLSHSDYVNELNGQIENLTAELGNMGLVCETTSNSLSETESKLEAKIQELEIARGEISGLQQSMALSQEQLEGFKADLQATALNQIREKELEFQKLLTENTNLIIEIDDAQDKVESLEAEIGLLKTELDEVKMHSVGKAADFKETLANKHFEITNLEATNAALNQELISVKQELATAIAQLREIGDNSGQIIALQENIDVLTAQKNNLLAEISVLQVSLSSVNASVSGLNETINGLNSKIEGYETEIAALRNNSKSAEQEAFIDRLFKQIDGLNDERLALLEEKEQMANQLLKMNDVIGSISQQVDSEKIDVSDLNNHRKNVILATNSGGVNEKSQMKEQINDLVREIDKCIALLSA